MPNTKSRDIFSLAAQVGDPDAAMATGRKEQQLRDAINQWTADYCTAIREFAFLLDPAINPLSGPKPDKAENHLEP